ncbi:hypothetical protein Tsubulata_027224 [Turnera subulata]|uniref:SET domain-containing protein n=1 Tax=Turnera subulata TaxID=218843 RepID=A0A9Q0FAT3_9ROSI|nr:hypothetical protein Tsubulata_027224 [Turnera subulata]
MREETDPPPQQPPPVEELMQELRSKATELLLREEWEESVHVYTQLINLCQHPDHLPKLRKSLCLALSNRAEARFRLRDFAEALKDCEEASRINETAHSKSLLCKGKILLALNRYSIALDCFKAALLDPHPNGGNLETLNAYVDRCKKLESQSKTGSFDLSDWVINGFPGKPPELAEYIGALQIKRSELSGRGLFATKNIDAGTLLFVTKAIAIERGILSSKDSDDNAQMVMWKDFVQKVVESATISPRIRHLISALSTGEEEEELEVPEIDIFRPETEEIGQSNEKVDMVRLMSTLDVNSLVEDSVSAKVLGKNSDYYGVGLWLLASFINHSCIPNARRLHVGDYLLVHASRDVKAGEEITFAYFDVLSPLDKREEMSRTWGFHCGCKRCKFEQLVCSRQEMEEIEMGLRRGTDVGGAISRLEEGMRRWMVRGKEKGYVRASFWDAYCEAYASDKSARRWGSRIPAADVAVDSVVEATGIDERVSKVLIQGSKRSGTSVMDMDKVLKLGRGLYGKVVKKHAMKRLLS